MENNPADASMLRQSLHQLSLHTRGEGFTDISAALDREIGTSGLATGLANLACLHTSCSLTINENADPDVPADLERALNATAPEDFPYVHTVEGPDDMPAHVKSVLIGSSVSLPVGNGKLMLGTWQGIYLAEHRDHATRRTLVLTLQGEAA